MKLYYCDLLTEFGKDISTNVEHLDNSQIIIVELMTL